MGYIKIWVHIGETPGLKSWVIQLQIIKMKVELP
jgi:hypothetical protein